MQLIEFATGCPPETPLVGFLAVKSSLHQEMTRRSHARGRRLREILLPVDWSQTGVYGLGPLEPAGLWIKHLWTKVQRLLPADRIPGGPGQTLKELCVVQNFSESRAAISLVSKRLDTTHSVPIGWMFPDQELGSGLFVLPVGDAITPPAKSRRQLALGDFSPAALAEDLGYEVDRVLPPSLARRLCRSLFLRLSLFFLFVLRCPWFGHPFSFLLSAFSAPSPSVSVPKAESFD